MAPGGWLRWVTARTVLTKIEALAHASLDIIRAQSDLPRPLCAVTSVNF